MSLVSVVIPSYNHAPYIRLAVESVLGQSHADLELIVVDDGSTDKTLEYLHTVRDSRYTLLEQTNAGAHNAINKGLGLAKGEYLAILNSDDMFHVDRLAMCLERLQAGHVDLVATWIEVIDHKGKVLGVKEAWHNMLPWPIGGTAFSHVQANDFSFQLCMTNFVSTTSNLVFTRSLYNAIGGMRNLRFAHDWDFLLRTAQHGNCELIEKPLLRYRTHQTNTISSNRAWMMFEICWIFAVHLKYYSSKLFRQTVDRKTLAVAVGQLAETINLQGNDKVLWMLMQFFEAGKGLGDPEPEQAILDDEDLRAAFIEYLATK